MWICWFIIFTSTHLIYSYKTQENQTRVTICRKKPLLLSFSSFYSSVLLKLMIKDQYDAFIQASASSYTASDMLCGSVGYMVFPLCISYYFWLILKLSTFLHIYQCPISSFLLPYVSDVFHTRVAPSKMYDVLKDDFDYIFIGAVTVGMIVVSLISRQIALRKMVNRAWK